MCNADTPSTENREVRNRIAELEGLLRRVGRFEFMTREAREEIRKALENDDD